MKISKSIKPDKVLYINPSNELYGADRSLLRLVKGIEGFDPLVIIPNDISYEGLLTSELDAHEVTYKELPISVLRRRYFTFFGLLLFIQRTIVSTFQLIRLCRQNDVKLIHTNSTAVIVGGLVARLIRVPHVWHVREIIVKPIWLNKLITFLLYWLADTVIAVSEPVKHNLVNGLPQIESKIKVIHNGLELSHFDNLDKKVSESIRSKWGIDNRCLVIGMVGRFSAWKGQDLFVEAVAKLIQDNDCLHAVMVGGDVPGETRHRLAIEEKITDLQLNGRIHIKPFSLNIPDILNSLDIFVLPSTSPDPFPTVVLEAMAVYLPVVATAHGGALEQVNDNISGFLVDPNKPKEMTMAIERLVNNEALRQNMGQEGNDRLKKLFTVEAYISNIIKEYRKLLSPN